MSNSYTHIYLSPHYDDASLSCGGAIHQQVQAGEAVLVITICAVPPQPGQPFSSFAQAMHRRWGNPADVVATRRAEDRASMEILGADFKRLGLTDAIYRGQPGQGNWFYTNNSQLFGPIHSDDLALTAAIIQAIDKLGLEGDQACLYAPLTVGHHVDHQLAHEAAWQLKQQGWTIGFYEDYPYVDPAYPFPETSPDGHNPYSLEATLAARRPARLQGQLRALTEENLAAKIKSVAAYGSQLQMLFGGEEAMADRVRSYALRTGQGQPVEQIWLPV